MAITFAVDEVAPAAASAVFVRPKPYLEMALGSPLEACSQLTERLVMAEPCNFLISAVDLAFCHHYPLSLSPDAIWLTLLQGLSKHTAEHAEECRDKLVLHEGKRALSLRRDDFAPGSPENPWEEVLLGFLAEMEGSLTPLAVGLAARFSTTGPVERAAAVVSLMDCLSSYFSYSLYTSCGIPEITLEGTPADWNDLRRRAQGFEALGLEYWLKFLDPILAEFEAASRGNVNREFWQQIYRRHEFGCGPPEYVGGWLNDLFPYVQDYPAGGRLGHGAPHESYPQSICRAAFQWESREMEMLGGLLGVEQDPESFVVSPRVGWAVREAQPAEMLSADSYGLYLVQGVVEQLVGRLNKYLQPIQASDPGVGDPDYHREVTRTALILLGAQFQPSGDGFSAALPRRARYARRTFEAGRTETEAPVAAPVRRPPSVELHPPRPGFFSGLFG